jgi:hypothetical protein
MVMERKPLDPMAFLAMHGGVGGGGLGDSDGNERCGAISVLVAPCMRDCMDTDKFPRVESS